MTSRTAVLSCMKDEGIFLLEWIAYHKAIGFDEIWVATNGCRDGSDVLLDCMADRGLVRHIHNVVPEDVPPQRAGIEVALAAPEMADIDWLLFIDSDEFLNIHAGDGKVADLIKLIPAHVSAVPLYWRLFGDSGMAQWDGGFVLQSFTKAQYAPRPRYSLTKTIFRPNLFKSGRDHMPKQPVMENPTVMTLEGFDIDPSPLFRPRLNRFAIPIEHRNWDNAAINHYAVKTPDIMRLKTDRGDGMGLDASKYTPGEKHHRSHNLNDADDRSILRHWDAVLRTLEDILADPEIDRLHNHCREWFFARRDALEHGRQN